MFNQYPSTFPPDHNAGRGQTSLKGFPTGSILVVSTVTVLEIEGVFYNAFSVSGEEWLYKM